MTGTKQILRAFMRNSSQVGAIAPSSPQLAEMMVDWLDWESLECIVEYGPGTGVFTEAIAARLPDKATFFAIERDSVLAEITRGRCPTVSVHESCVTRVAELCRESGVGKIDAVVCGLPWASFSGQLQKECLDAMFEMLPPGGQFSTFAYWQGLALPAGQRFRRYLRKHFSSVEQSKTVWQNVPPAFVYRCVR